LFIDCAFIIVQVNILNHLLISQIINLNLVCISPRSGQYFIILRN
jgi:hypothetical protein